MNNLIDKLERADGPDRELDFLIAIETDWRWPEWEEGEPTIKRLAEKHGLAWALSNDRRQSIWRDIPKFSGSIDTAMTLVPEGWRPYSADMSVKGQTRFLIEGPKTQWSTDEDGEKCAGNDWYSQGVATTPAIAALIAALRARSQGGE